MKFKVTTKLREGIKDIEGDAIEQKLNQHQIFSILFLLFQNMGSLNYFLYDLMFSNQ